MEIKYIGHSSFLIKTKSARLVTDPFDPKATGLKFPKTEADIVTVSHNHEDHNYLGQIAFADGKSSLVIDMPGEFESYGIRIFGYRSFHDSTGGKERGENILYKIESEGVSVLHCGDLGLVPDDQFIDQIGDVDVLMVPTGGVYTIDPDQAYALVKKIEPSIVIPMHFNRSGLDQKIFSGLKTVDEFVKKYGIEKIDPIPKLVVKKDETEDEMKVVVMGI